MSDFDSFEGLIGGRGAEFIDLTRPYEDIIADRDALRANLGIDPEYFATGSLGRVIREEGSVPGSSSLHEVCS